MTNTQYGHFDDLHREYVITNPQTPFPWINYLGNEDFFGLISNTAGGYDFYKDAKFRRITRYRYNSVPMDNGGRYFYIKDGDVVIVRQQDDADSGKICVVMINGFDATLKEIKKDPQGLWVLPHNSECDFKPSFFSNQQVDEVPVRIIGVAVEIRRSL